MVFSRERLLETVEQARQDTEIDPEKLAEYLSILAEVGRTENGGISRYVYSLEEAEVKAIFKRWLLETGLQVTEDSAGNIRARLEAGDLDAPVVMTGSHLDTVPDGGAFDGALGCVSSLLAVQALANEKDKLKRPVELVVFVDEEGSRFGNGLFGSRAMMGEVTAEEVANSVDEENIGMEEAMAQRGLSLDRLSESIVAPSAIHSFLEVHIEQGTQLEETGATVGVVHGIAGPSWHSCTFIGETDHAGNTPMKTRKDALAAMGELLVALESMPPHVSEEGVATIGKLDVIPNGANVIAGEVNAVIDIRDVDKEAREQIVAQAKARAEQIATERKLELKWETQLMVDPVQVPATIQAMIQNGAEKQGLKWQPIASGAAHDAMTLGKYVPAGMIFVPSIAGKSHSPEEFTTLSDATDGVIALKEALFALATQ
ncbi:Zn-dependent hydrolase [Salsuginibacillus kocurii]|uniref:Zn-dependent hydrolase n=1 Tax=Salsuginibacillus kocurii TaxID=427078 RepID=UPI00036EBB63|nr:Zn-dependent hydrolase [Salsuginibacillus kocurii]